MYVRVYVCGMSVCVYMSIGVFVCVWCVCVIVVGVCVFLYVCTMCEGGVCMCIVCQFVWCVSVFVCMWLEKLTGMVYMKRPNKLNTRSTIPGPIPGCNSSIPVSTYFLCFILMLSSLSTCISDVHHISC